MKTRYHDVLRSNSREFSSFVARLTLDDMIIRSWERRIEWEHIRKKKAGPFQIVGVSAKKPNVADRMTGFAGRVVRDATSAASQGTLQGLYSLYQCYRDIRHDFHSFQSEGPKEGQLPESSIRRTVVARVPVTL